MASLILLEGTSKAAVMVAQTLRYACDAVVVDQLIENKSTVKIAGQLSMLSQVADQITVPVVLQNMLFTRAVPAEKRQAVADWMRHFDCKLVMVTDFENANVKSWLREAFDESSLDKIEYDLSYPISSLVRFVKGE